MWRLSRASFNTTPYYPLLCMYFFIFYCFIFYIVSVQFGKKCNASWREGRNLIIWAIKPLREEGGGGGDYSTTFILFYFFMPRGSAPRSNPLAFRILFWTKKGPPSYYMTIVELCITCNYYKCTSFKI